jgi:hypothetical protein
MTNTPKKTTFTPQAAPSVADLDIPAIPPGHTSVQPSLHAALAALGKGLHDPDADQRLMENEALRKATDKAKLSALVQGNIPGMDRGGTDTEAFRPHTRTLADGTVVTFK